MRLFDFTCPDCGLVAADIHIPLSENARVLWCLFDFTCPDCGLVAADIHIPLSENARVLWCFSHREPVRMVRQYAAPPQIWNTGGRGGQ